MNRKDRHTVKVLAAEIIEAVHLADSMGTRDESLQSEIETLLIDALLGKNLFADND